MSRIVFSALSIGLVVMSGCSTGIFKPVQPWYTSDKMVRSAEHPHVLNENANQERNVVSVDPNRKVELLRQEARPFTSSSPVIGQNPRNVVVDRGGRVLADTGSQLNSAWSNAGETSQQGSKGGAPTSNRSAVSQSSESAATESSAVPVPAKVVNHFAGNANQAHLPVNLTPQSNYSNQQSINPSRQPDLEPTETTEQTDSRSELKTPLYFGDPAGSQDTTTTTFYRSQGPQDDSAAFIPTTFANQGQIQQTAAQNPELQNTRTPVSPFQNPSINIGSPNELNPFDPGFAPSGSATFPQNYADLDIYLSETSTGRINFGGAYNSDSGLVGQFVIDERNFDIFRLPRNFREIVDGTAWRGGGQNFRLELVPGNDVERYLVSFSEPFLMGSRVSFSSSLYYFQRQFFDYDEERLGGRFAFGYRLTPDISVSTGIRLENVEISDPRNMTSPTLNSTVGDTDLYVGNVSLIRDTRDHPFLPTEGNYVSMTYSQGFGEFDYSRGDIDFRTYRLMYQRPDGSGRHTLSYGTKLGFTGSQTPFFENYFAGGFSTLRGFDFRGASPIEGDIRVGGEFQWLNTIEYTFPLTADDMVKGVLFTDFGTVEENIEIDSDNFRVAPGFGFRVHLPAAGIGAPLAFDFAFPVSEAAGDDEEVFSFYLGVSR